MCKPRVRRTKSWWIYRFTFPMMSDGFRDFSIAWFDVTAKNKEQAKKDAVVLLEKNMGAAANAMTPEQAVEVATITEIARDVEITVIGRWPKKNFPKG